MFGCFSPEEVTQLHNADIAAWATVTSVKEAQAAAAAGVDALVVKGPEAGGHRGV